MTKYSDYLDFFSSEINFTNRITSIIGKVLSVLFLLIFGALSLNTMTSIFLKVSKSITNLQSIDSSYVPIDQPNFYSHLHLITYLQLFNGSGGSYSQEETKSIVSKYFNAQVFFFNANNYQFSYRRLEDLACGGQDNVIIYCYDFEMTNTQDFFFVSFNKHVLISDSKFVTFMNDSILRLQYDYYFLPHKSPAQYYFSRNELDKYLDVQNKNFKEAGFGDYVKQSRSSFDMRFDKGKLGKDFNNPILNLKIIDLLLDEGVIFSQNYNFASYTLNQINYPFSPNLFSVTFKSSSVIEGYTFNYKKIANGFSEIAGVIQFIRICFLGICIFVNSMKVQAFFSSNLYIKKIAFLNGGLSSKNKNSVWNTLKHSESVNKNVESVQDRTVSRFNVHPGNATQIRLAKPGEQPNNQTNLSSLRNSNVLNRQ